VPRVFHGTPCNSCSLLLYFLGLSRAGVAQLVEHLICNQRVGGSNPSASSAKNFLSQGMIPVAFGKRVSASRSWQYCVSSFWLEHSGLLVVIPPCGRVGEWLKPADCKSAAPCGLRRFESSPVHHLIAIAGEALKHGRSVFFFYFETRPRREIRWSNAFCVSV
jgi:hypothetical protein